MRLSEPLSELRGCSCHFLVLMTYSVRRTWKKAEEGGDGARPTWGQTPNAIEQPRRQERWRLNNKRKPTRRTGAKTLDTGHWTLEDNLHPDQGAVLKFTLSLF